MVAVDSYGCLSELGSEQQASSLGSESTDTTPEQHDASEGSQLEDASYRTSPLAIPYTRWARL